MGIDSLIMWLYLSITGIILHKKKKKKEPCSQNFLLHHVTYLIYF